MAAYLRVYDSRHVQADCQEPGSAREPYTRQSSMGVGYVAGGDLTGHGAPLLVVGLLVADQTVGAERVGAAQHLGVAIALEADHTLQQLLHRVARRHVGFARVHGH